MKTLILFQNGTIRDESGFLYGVVVDNEVHVDGFDQPFPLPETDDWEARHDAAYEAVRTHHRELAG